MSRNVTLAAPADVRFWANESGLSVGSRGRFAPDLVKAFNKGHNGKGGSAMRYVEADFVPTEKVTVKVEGKRSPTTLKVDLKAARVWARETGLLSGTERGRLSASTKVAFAKHLADK